MPGIRIDFRSEPLKDAKPATFFVPVLLRGEEDHASGGWYVKPVALSPKGDEYDDDDIIVAYTTAEEARQCLAEVMNEEFYKKAWWYDDIVRKHGGLYKIRVSKGYLREDGLFHSTQEPVLLN
jgi:hypothetical protein